MFAPILPRPTIPSCINTPPWMSLLNSLTLFFQLLDAISSQPAHCFGHSFALTKNRRSCYQDVGSGSGCQGRGFSIDTPVHLYVAAGLDLLQHVTDLPDLGQGCGQEMLVSKTG